ncbi:hypothetical protein ACVWWK_002654 [Bradyrhizobium sp. LB9.1b]|jgi:hypothetical protein
MLASAFPFLDPVHISSDLSDRLRKLADDCDRLRHGQDIPVGSLTNAPLLQDWIPVLTAEGVKLAGYVTGHPLQGNRLVMTTPLWWADPSGHWVRSISRFYRLGAFRGRPQHLQ